MLNKRQKSILLFLVFLGIITFIPQPSLASDYVTLSGRVTKDNGQPIAGVVLDLCHGMSAFTDANGYWSKQVERGTYFCVRISSGLPGGYSRIKAVKNNYCNSGASTYEYQVAGENFFKGCFYEREEKWDLCSDNEFDFIIEIEMTAFVALNKVFSLIILIG